MNNLFEMTATAVAREIREKRLGVEELTRAYIERIEKYDGLNGLNSVLELNDTAIAQAKKMDSMKSGRNGVMFGLPVLIKDNIDVSGLHTTAGSLALADNLAKEDAQIVDVNTICIRSSDEVIFHGFIYSYAFLLFIGM